MNKVCAAIVLAMVTVLVMGYASNEVIQATNKIACGIKIEQGK